MKIAVFSAKSYDRNYLNAANSLAEHELVYFETTLNGLTSKLADGFPGVSVFVNDKLNREVLSSLAESGTRMIALRCAGFNNVDIKSAEEFGIAVFRVPDYSPYSVAEHTIALIMTLLRNTHKAYQRGRYGNFSLEGLMGQELHGKTVGIIGTGKIGYLTARILQGFGCKLLGFDIAENLDCLRLGMRYVGFDTLLSQSHIISLHCPLNEETHHLFDDHVFTKMQNGSMLINTGRGAIIDSNAAIRAIKSGKLGHLGLDVYEQESDIFFEDLSNKIIDDDIFERLLTFPNVLITGHQGFFTDTALKNIADTTIENVSHFQSNKKTQNMVTSEPIR